MHSCVHRRIARAYITRSPPSPFRTHASSSSGGVFHRLEERIRAHVLICWLALLLVRIAERESGQTWRRMRTELERVKLVTLTGAAGSVEQTTPLSDSQREILAALDVAPPPPLASLDPA